MIVDDEEMIKHGLSAVISRATSSFQVTALAEDGCEALEMLRCEQPHVLFTDIRMPCMDGLTLIAELRKELPELIVVVISGYSDFSYAQQAMRYGVFDYLLKPIKPLEVERILLRAEEHLRQRKSWWRQERNWIEQSRHAVQVSALALWELDKEAWRKETALLATVISCYADDAVGLKHRYEDFWRQIDSILSDRLQAGEISSEHLYRSMPKYDETAPLAWLQQCGETFMEWLRVNRNWVKHYKILDALQYVERNFTNPETTQQIVAEQLGLSVSHFSRSFKEEIGCTFSQYITNMRLAYAQKMLMEPHRKVTEIAELSGYPDYPHFSKTFKKHFGLSPVEFRNQKRPVADIMQNTLSGGRNHNK